MKDVNNLASIMHEAIYVAKAGRPGPVVVDLPKDILIAETFFDLGQKTQKKHKTYRPKIKGDNAKMNIAIDPRTNPTNRIP